MSKQDERSRVSRRGFLYGVAGLGGLALAGSALEGASPEPASTSGRLGAAYEVRRKAAEHARSLGRAKELANGDETRLPRRIACYSKGLPHDKAGEPDLKAYDVLLKALQSGDPEDFERIPLGGFVKLANPQAALAFDLVGPDGCQLALGSPPGFAGAEQAAEMVELYWHALARGVPFAAYGS